MQLDKKIIHEHGNTCTRIFNLEVPCLGALYERQEVKKIRTFSMVCKMNNLDIDIYHVDDK